MNSFTVKRLSIVIITVLILILGACKPNEAEVTPSPSNTDPPVTETPTIEKPTPSPPDITDDPSPSADIDKPKAIVNDNVIEKEYSIEGTSEDIVGHLFIAVPEIAHDEYTESAEMINEYFASLKEKYREGFEIELDSLVDEDLYGFGARRSLELSFITKYNKDGIVSFYISVTSYQGGAHDSMEIMSETFDLSEGTRITADTLFTADEKEYTARIKEYILSEMNERAQEEYSPYYDNYADLLEATYNKESFVLTENGLRVYFQVYDLAPYAGGSIQFDIPYANIADILNPEYINPKTT